MDSIDVVNVDGVLEYLPQGIDPLARVFGAQFLGGFTIDPAECMSTGAASAPVLRHDGLVMNNDFTAVDRFTAMTGVTATLFVRDGDDFVRVSTSLKNERGERAVGTKLARGHPGYAPLLAGQSCTGPARRRCLAATSSPATCPSSAPTGS